MSDADEWAKYDVAKNCLSIIIGHFSELVHNELQKDSPDLAKIERWEQEQESFIDQEATLTAEDHAAVAKVNEYYAPTARAIMDRSNGPA